MALIKDLKLESTENLHARIKVLQSEVDTIRSELLARENGKNLKEIGQHAVTIWKTAGRAPAVRYYRAQAGCGLNEALDAVTNLVNIDAKGAPQ